MRLDGFISLASVRPPGGPEISALDAVKCGLIDIPVLATTDEWPRLEPGELPVGTNLHTNGGRQLMIYCWGNRAPITDFAVKSFAVGTGNTPELVTDVDLDEPVANFHAGGQFKDVGLIDYPEPYIARVSITIASDEAVGLSIKEFGLYSGNQTLVNRSVLEVPINKGNLAKTFLWRVRF